MCNNVRLNVSSAKVNSGLSYWSWSPILLFFRSISGHYNLIGDELIKIEFDCDIGYATLPTASRRLLSTAPTSTIALINIYIKWL